MSMQHHVRLGPDELAGNGELGRYVFLPGDPSRAGRIAERFEDARALPNPRGLDAWTGRLPGADGDEAIDVLAVASGIGAGSAEVVVHELLACGARRLLRVGSCGSMTARIQPGQVVVAVGAVRDEAATGHYAPPEYPAVAHPDVVAAMSEGARRAGLAGETFRGLCHSKASLFAREFGHGPAAERNRRYCDELARAGVVASEMEASTLFVLAATAAPWGGPIDGGWAGECQAGAVLAVFGTDQSDMKVDPELVRLAEERAITVAVEGTRVWAGRDRRSRGWRPGGMSRQPSRIRPAVWIAAVAAAGVAALVVPTLFLKPYSIDHFYTRLYLQFAWRRPMLLSQLRVLEPLGMRFHNDELDDLSLDFQIAEAEWVERQLAILRRFDRAALEPEARVSYDAVGWFLEDVARGRPFMLYDYPVNQFSGVQSSLPEFMLAAHRIDDLRDARDYVRRIGRFGVAFAQVRAGLEARRRRGIVAPPFVLRMVLREMREFIAVEPPDHPLYLHLAARLDALEIPSARRAALLDALRAALADELYPAYRQLIAAVEELEQEAGDAVGAWSLPDGAAFYDYALDHHATTDVSADEIHRLGLAEVARLEGEIRGVLSGLGGLGELDGLGVDAKAESPAAAIRRLAREPRFLFSGDETGRRQMLDDYRRIIADIESRLDELFEHRPGAVAVEAVPEAEQLGSPAAYYRPPAADGSRPGTLLVNLRQTDRMPRFAMRALAYHEAIPGHHCQGALATGGASEPLLRRMLPLTAFVEGWALYAETLAGELGFLDDPYDRLGHLEAELFRAARLVVDTGIHLHRWDRQRAVEYMTATTGMPRGEALVEVERQIVNPGQACAYKIGQREFLRLRARARQRLAERFDLRRFHTAVLEHGALPLELLERVVETWIDGEIEGGRTSAG